MELDALLETSRKKEEREMKFMAAINGVELNEEDKVEEVTKDVTALQNAYTASKEGFGVGEGLGFMQLE